MHKTVKLCTVKLCILSETFTEACVCWRTRRGRQTRHGFSVSVLAPASKTLTVPSVEQEYKPPPSLFAATPVTLFKSPASTCSADSDESHSQTRTSLDDPDTVFFPSAANDMHVTSAAVTPLTPHYIAGANFHNHNIGSSSSCNVSTTWRACNTTTPPSKWNLHQQHTVQLREERAHRYQVRLRRPLLYTSQYFSNMHQ